MDELFTLTGAGKDSIEVAEWLSQDPIVLYEIARYWHGVIQQCGDDVAELLHDGCPSYCVDNAAFAYVNVYSKHVNLGFYWGAMIDDPMNLLQGSGKRMRHIKLLPDSDSNHKAIERLIQTAYKDIRTRLNLC